MSLILKYDFGNPHRLPVGYTPLAYIESTGIQYIDTNVVMNNTVKVYCKMQAITKGGYFYNAGSGSSSPLTAWAVDSGYNWRYGGLAATPTPTLKSTEVCEIFHQNSGVSINGANFTYSGTPSFNSHNIYIFDSTNNSNIRCYFFKIWKNNVLIIDFIPAKRNSDGVIGMFDIVSQTFKTNAGTGEFIAGPEVVVLPYEYQQVEYLESNGGQYINTGLVVTSDNGNSYDFEAQVVPLSFTNYQVVAGVNSNTQFAWSTGGVACIGNAYSSSAFFTLNTMAKITGKFAASAQTYYVNGTSTGLSRAINTTTNIYLFGIHASGYNMVGRLQYAKFGVARNFIPCYRRSDLKPGMYDTVHNVFYTNAGSGEFILGPVVEESSRQLEYNNAGSNYIGVSKNVHHSIDNPSTTQINFGSGDFAGGAKITATIPDFGNSFSISWWGKGTYGGNMMWSIYPFNPLYQRCLNFSDGQSNPWYIPGTTTRITTPTNNVWHHFVVTGDGTTNKLYVDGVHYGTSKTYKGLTGRTSLIFNGWDLTTSYNFNGKLYDFRIYDNVLTDDEVLQIYKLGL